MVMVVVRHWLQSWRWGITWNASILNKLTLRSTSKSLSSPLAIVICRSSMSSHKVMDFIGGIVHFLDATLSTFYILFCCLIDFIRTFGRLTDVGKDLELEVLSACLLSPLSDAGLTNTFLNNWNDDWYLTGYLNGSFNISNILTFVIGWLPLFYQFVWSQCCRHRQSSS